ncbi:MAG: sulfite exporter TauE/SafE family protein [Magnetococcus sp. YQC-5]
MNEAFELAFPTTALLGLTMGLTACTAYCLPYFGSWVLGHNATHPWQDAGWFLLGRVMAYAVLGWAAAGLGQVVMSSGAGQVGRLVLSGVSVLVGFVLLFNRFPTRSGVCPQARMGSWSPMLLGMAVSLVPCPPLAALLAACSLTGNAMIGLLHGGLFGLTASLAPVVLVSSVLGHAGQAMRGLFPGIAPWLRLGAGVALIALALRPFLV